MQPDPAEFVWYESGTSSSKGNQSIPYFQTHFTVIKAFRFMTSLVASMQLLLPLFVFAPPGYLQR
jgi:hypothetical protein